MPDRPPLTLGTAGHIDHGKTALVKRLTGTDTDRLPEEKERGITIELGFAELALPSGAPAERRRRARATSASSAPWWPARPASTCFLLVVAADDGVMPQTPRAPRHHRAAGRAATAWWR